MNAKVRKSDAPITNLLPTDLVVWLVDCLYKVS